MERTMANGEELKDGDYRVDVDGTRGTIHRDGHHKIQLTAKQVMNAPHKFERSQVLVNNSNGQPMLEESASAERRPG